MSTERARIREKARRNGEETFTSLYHHITDVDNLRACFHELDGKKAVGVDGVSKEEYGRELEANLLDLSDRLKRGGTDRHRVCGSIFRRRVPKRVAL